MKKITFLLLTMLALQVGAQGTWTEPGKYTVSTLGLTPELYMTINTATGDLEWQPVIGTGDDDSQVWTIVTHRFAASGQPGGASFMELTANVLGMDFTLATNAVEADGKNVTLIARPGLPIDNTADPSDLSGKDQFQRRKTNPAPPVGNNALFIKLPWDGGSRFGVTPAAAGDPVQFDGGGIDALEFTLIESLSNEAFDSSSIVISNPVSNQLTINGLTANVKEVSVYSLLGKQVLTRSVKAQSALTIDVSALTSGMYLVEMKGDNGIFTKKIVKQ